MDEAHHARRAEGAGTQDGADLWSEQIRFLEAEADRAQTQGWIGHDRTGLASAINLFMINLIALGLGPLIVGMASDYFNARFGANALRYSILAVVLVAYNWAAVHFFLAARTLRQDLATAEASH